jgi:putative ABC transport system permease protein
LRDWQSAWRRQRAAAPAGVGGIGWRYGLASLERRASASVVQIVALALGFMALLLLTVIRGDLLDAWRKAVPPMRRTASWSISSPNRWRRCAPCWPPGALSSELAPMVRGRLTRINGVEVSAADYTDDRAQRLIEREFNLSMRADLPEGNSVRCRTLVFGGRSRGRWR